MSIRINWFFVLLAVIALASCDQKKERPNILFIVADDMTYGQLSFDGCKGISTPNLDKLAQNGLYFENAYCSAPSCSPSRASILTGKNGYELEEGAGLFGHLPKKFETYTDILQENGYKVGYTGKGWGPGSVEAGGRTHNPAGKAYNEQKLDPFPELGSNGGIFNIDYAGNFEAFLTDQTEAQPFCFWYGPFEPHRVFDEGIGQRAGRKLSEVEVPAFLPDTEEVRADLLDFYFEIEWIDTQVGRMLEILEERGTLENTLIVFTSDNGMPFPRAKCTLYEAGTHMPLIAYWASEITEARKVNDFINLADLAPTFIEAAGVDIPEDMTARSFLNVLQADKTGLVDPSRNFTVSYKERHSIVQATPHDIAAMRSIRQGDFLLIWNLFPDLWPLGHINPKYNPFLMPFGDSDDGRTKTVLMKNMHGEQGNFFELAFLPKGVEYELYNVQKDPDNLNNLAGEAEYAEVMTDLKQQLESYLAQTNDPRMVGGAEVFSEATYHGWQGLASGFMPPRKFNNLNEAEKERAMQKADSVLQENRKKLQGMGWDIAVIDTIQ